MAKHDEEIFILKIIVVFLMVVFLDCYLGYC